MSVLHAIWTTSIVLAVWAILSVFSLLMLRVLRERTLRREAVLRARESAEVQQAALSFTQLLCGEAVFQRTGHFLFESGFHFGRASVFYADVSPFPLHVLRALRDCFFRRRKLAAIPRAEWRRAIGGEGAAADF